VPGKVGRGMMKTVVILAAFLVALAIVLASGFYTLHPVSTTAAYKINKISGTVWWLEEGKKSLVKKSD
jgi:hypothetical protein